MRCKNSACGNSNPSTLFHFSSTWKCWVCGAEWEDQQDDLASSAQEEDKNGVPKPAEPSGETVSRGK